jgi:predicted transcriptional regulator
VSEDLIAQVKALIEALRIENEEKHQRLSSVLGEMIDTRHKAAIDGLQEAEKGRERIKAVMDLLETSDAKQTAQVDSLMASFRALSNDAEETRRHLAVVRSRLDGTQVEQLPEKSLEAMRRQGDQSAEQLAGAGGLPPLRQIQSSQQNLDFVLAAVKVIGATATAGVISYILGVGRSPDLSGTVSAQASKIEQVVRDLERVEQENSKLRARLDALMTIKIPK